MKTIFRSALFVLASSGLAFGEERPISTPGARCADDTPLIKLSQGNTLKVPKIPGEKTEIVLKTHKDPQKAQRACYTDGYQKISFKDANKHANTCCLEALTLPGESPKTLKLSPGDKLDIKSVTNGTFGGDPVPGITIFKFYDRPNLQLTCNTRDNPSQPIFHSQKQLDLKTFKGIFFSHLDGLGDLRCLEDKAPKMPIPVPTESSKLGEANECQNTSFNADQKETCCAKYKIENKMDTDGINVCLAAGCQTAQGISKSSDNCVPKGTNPPPFRKQPQGGGQTGGSALPN